MKSNRRQSLVFSLNLHAFFGLYSLMQAIAPSAACHEATSKLVNNHNLTAIFALLHDIVLVTMVQMVSAQCRVQVVYQRNVGRIIKRGAFRNQPQVKQDSLGVFVALLGQKNLLRFFIERKVPRLCNALTCPGVSLAFLAHKGGHNLVHGQIHFGVIFCLAADD